MTTVTESSASVLAVLAPAKSLWEGSGLPADALERLHLSEHPDPAVDSSFRLGTAAQVSDHCVYDVKEFNANQVGANRPSLDYRDYLLHVSTN